MFLNAKMRQKRYNWAKEHESWSINDWQKVLFSDESKIEIPLGNGRKIYRRQSFENPLMMIQPKVKNELSVMMWGCFSSSGTGRLKLIRGSVNSDKYIEILEECLPYSIRRAI